MEENTNLTPEQVVEKVGAMFSEKMQNVPTNEDITALKSEVDSLKSLEEKSSEIEKSIAKFEGRLEAMTEKAVEVKSNEPVTLAGKIFKTIKENFDNIKDAVQKGQRAKFEVKDTTINDNYVGDYALTEWDGVDRIQRTRYGILDAVNRGTTTSKFITYVSQTTSPKNVWVGEAEAKEERVIDWKETSVEVKKIAGYVKVSKEMLEDLSFIRSEINLDLMERLREDIETALLNGAGGLQIDGLLSLGIGLPLFNAGTFAGTIAGANVTDVIRVAKAQIESANFDPTHIVMNPVDIAKLQLTKGSDNTYTYPMYLPTGDEVMRVAGIQIVSSNYIAQDQYLLGDMSKVNVRFRNDMTLDVGLDQDDFTRNMITILAEARLVQYVKRNQKNAFVIGTFSTDIAALTPTP